MDKFEMLLNEITQNKKAEPKKSVQFNTLGSRMGEQREIVVRYAVGRENEAKVYEGTLGENGKKEDSYALLYATGNLIGDITGIEGKELGAELTKAAMKAMVGGTLKGLMKELEDALK